MLPQGRGKVSEVSRPGWSFLADVASYDMPVTIKPVVLVMHEYGFIKMHGSYYKIPEFSPTLFGDFQKVAILRAIHTQWTINFT